MPLLKTRPYMPLLPTMNGVELRHIPGTVGYAVGDDGSVWTCRAGRTKNGLQLFRKSWRPLKAIINGEGYPMVGLSPQKKAKKWAPSPMYLVHRLVLEAFHGPCPEDMEGCHNNGDRRDCRLANLRWDTREANHRDKLRHAAPRVKISPDDASMMVKLIDYLSLVDIGMLYDVTPARVSKMIRPFIGSRNLRGRLLPPHQGIRKHDRQKRGHQM